MSDKSVDTNQSIARGYLTGVKVKVSEDAGPQPATDDPQTPTTEYRDPQPEPVPGFNDMTTSGGSGILLYPADDSSASFSPNLTEADEAAAEEMRDELLEKVYSFRETLRHLRAKGVEIRMPRGIAYVSDFENSEDNELKQALTYESFTRNNEIPVLGVSNFTLEEAYVGKPSPDLMAREGGKAALEKDPDLYDGRPAVTVLPLAISVKKVGDHLIALLWNWFEDEPLLVKKIPTRNYHTFCLGVGCKPDEPWASIGRSLYREAAAHLKGFDSEAALKALPELSRTEKLSLDDNELFNLIEPEGWTEDDIEGAEKSLESLTKSFDIKMYARPFQADTDRDETRAMAFEPLELVLDGDAVDEFDDRALGIYGFFDFMALEVRDEEETYRLAEDPKIKGFEGDYIIDKYGNVIEPIRGRNKITGKEVFLGFAISPPYHLSKTPGEFGPDKAFGVDLTSFGMGDHKKLLSQISLAPRKAPTPENPYYFYSTLARRDSGKIKGTIGRVMQLTSEAETAFGLAPGTVIKNIFYIPSQSENASVRFANPESLMIWDEMLPMLKEEKRNSVVFHEVCHGIDMQYNISSHPKFDSIYKLLTESSDTQFLYKINEGKFMPGGIGGHAQDNRFEFFASLMNSLNSSDWEGSVRKMEWRMRGLYYEALKGVRVALALRMPGIKSAPIYKTLMQRISYMEDQRTDASGMYFPYGTLDQLVLKPATEILKSGPEPIKVLTAAQFEQEVLKSKTPVVVYTYDDQDRDLVDPIRDISRFVSGRFKFVTLKTDDAMPFISSAFGGIIGGGRLYLFQDGRLIYSSSEDNERLKRDLDALPPP